MKVRLTNSIHGWDFSQLSDEDVKVLVKEDPYWFLAGCQWEVLREPSEIMDPDTEAQRKIEWYKGRL